MPDRDLPKRLRDQLSASLEVGAPLTAPLPSQARFATVRRAVPTPRWRLRALTVAVAAAGIVVVAFAGPPQPRQWFSTLTRQVGVPAGDVSPSPTNQNQPAAQASQQSGRRAAPVASPEPRESPVPRESPEPGESPDGNGAQASPSATPSPGDH